MGNRSNAYSRKKRTAKQLGRDIEGLSSNIMKVSKRVDNVESVALQLQKFANEDSTNIRILNSRINALLTFSTLLNNKLEELCRIMLDEITNDEHYPIRIRELMREFAELKSYMYPLDKAEELFNEIKKQDEEIRKQEEETKRKEEENKNNEQPKGEEKEKEG